ncbi:hypothetical protein FDB42_10245 [Clostridium botulinum]|nr:hypothetical protein [Clostridium botulinum]
MKKIIYLDQNKWIELSRCYYGREVQDETKEILNLVEKKSLSGEWIFPLSIIHYNETRTRKQEEQREKLAKFMGIISKNWGIYPYRFDKRNEFKLNTLKREYTPIKYNPGCLFGKLYNPSELLTKMNLKISDKQKDEINDTISRFNFFLYFNKYGEDDSVIDEFREDNKMYQQCFEGLREENTEHPISEKYKEAVLFAQCFEKEYGYVFKELEEYQKSKLTDNKKKEMEYKFYQDRIPKSFYTNMFLIYQSKLKNTQRKNHINDYKDIVSISEALPYCDVLITEKYWSSLIIEHGLDKYFNTVVSDDIKVLKGLV